MGLVAKYRERTAATAPAPGAPPVPPGYATGTVFHEAVQPDGSVVHHRQELRHATRAAAMAAAIADHPNATEDDRAAATTASAALADLAASQHRS